MSQIPLTPAHISKESLTGHAPQFRKKFHDAFRAVLLIIVIFPAVFFIESKRIGILAVGMDPGLLQNTALAYVSLANRMKETVLLHSYRTTDWQSPAMPETGTEGSVATATAISVAPSAPTIPFPLPPYRIAIVGDSFIADRFGIDLENILRLYDLASVFREGKYSTGLTRPDYFDWNEEIEKIIAKENPNIILVMFGANDGQSLLENGKIILRKSPEWNGDYEERVDKFVSSISKKGIAIFWIGHPISRDNLYNKKIVDMTNIYQLVLSRYPNTSFIPMWNVLEDKDGAYSDYLPNSRGKEFRARSSDGIHVTDFGAQFMLDVVLKNLESSLGIKKIPPASASSSIHS